MFVFGVVKTKEIVKGTIWFIGANFENSSTSFANCVFLHEPDQNLGCTSDDGESHGDGEKEKNAGELVRT